MSLTVAWLMERPAGLTETDFEEWYLDVHAVVAKRGPGLQRYTVNRLWTEPNRRSDSTVFRIAQLWWASADAATASFNSFEGMATFGDGVINSGLAYTKGIALTHDRQLPVTTPACFDIVTGGFAGSDDGTITKVMAYGAARDSGLVEAYAARFGELGLDDRVRQHILGAGRGEVIRPGRISVPAPHDVVHDWSLELWFDDAATAEAFLDESAFAEAWAWLDGHSSTSFLGVFCSQELFFSTPAIAFGG
jgi:uncharacterized protein (TIGR02118 family)